MRLTESLANVLYQRALDTNKIDALNRSFEEHLGLKNRFHQKQSTDKDGKSKSTWAKLSIQGYECYEFSKKLHAAGTFCAETAIERVIHEVWPSRVDANPAHQSPRPALCPDQNDSQSLQMGLSNTAPVAAAGRGRGAKGGKAKPTGNKTASSAAVTRAAESGTGNSGAVNEQNQPQKKAKTRQPVRQETAEEEARFIELLCALWRLFHLVTKQMRCKDPGDSSLKDFGINCCNLGARWCMFLPRNRCSALYLHTIMMHGGAFMTYLLDRGLTIGMLENSGAERRHQIGKVMFRKALGGGGNLLLSFSGLGNLTAYLTLRGLLIWSYGRDMLAYFLAEEKQQEAAAKHTGKRLIGWDSIGASLGKERELVGQKSRAYPALAEVQYNDPKDRQLDTSGCLTDEALFELETQDEESQPVELVAKLGLLPADIDAAFSTGSAGGNFQGAINPDLPIVMPDGRHIADLDGAVHDDSDKDGSGGSESGEDMGLSCSEDDGESGADSPDEDAA